MHILNKKLVRYMYKPMNMYPKFCCLKYEIITIFQYMKTIYLPILLIIVLL